MFLKPFRTKSNIAMKGSERKRLRAELVKVFNDEMQQDVPRNLIPNKEEMSVMKVYSNKGENVFVYCLRKNPILFEHEKVIYPTIYTVWNYPSALPCITTQPQVIERLFSGADLMLPGVIVPKSGLPLISKGQVVAVNAFGNQSPLAVGYALMSSKDMVETAGMRGKGIKIIHTFGDHLWMAGDKQQPPQIPMDDSSMQLDPNMREQLADYFSNGEEKNSEKESIDHTEDALDQEEDSTDPNTNIEELQDLRIEDPTGQDEEIEQDDEVEDLEEDPRSESEIMDELLYSCFMTALKQKLKDPELPILTSTFYRTHVLQCCPANKFLDIKKSSHKKLSKYLRHVASTGLIEVKEITKGNDNLISVARSHPDLRAFKVPESSTSESEPSEEANTTSSYGVVTQRKYEPPEMSVVHTVSSVSLPLFSTLGYKKGSPMTLPEIRDAVTRYIRENDLVRSDAPRMVTLDPLLHRAMYDKGGNNILSATWEDIFKKVISKLQPCHQLKFKGMSPILKTGEPPSIKILVQQRASNKRVTIVDNLEGFLIDPTQFAELMRKKAQASTSISNVPVGGSNKILQQVLIQGNQVSLIENLLTGPDYRIPRRYLKGLENAPKPKKKGR